MYIALDFDGTCVKHAFPAVGEDIGAAPWLLKFVEEGAELLLNTMRDGDHLLAAVHWFAMNGVPLLGVNVNPDQKSWTDSPKVYANLYIDDAAFGCPLREDHVDWDIVGPAVLERLKKGRKFNDKEEITAPRDGGEVQ
jgi:hypothetical protein